MKKVKTTIVAAVLMSTSAQAQVQPRVLGDNHVMVSIDTDCKYVLLPVDTRYSLSIMNLSRRHKNMP